MLTPKKVIPGLAVALLALTGCGSDVAPPGGGSAGRGGAGGSGGSGGTAGMGGGSGGTAGMGGGGGTGGGSISEGLANSIRGWCMNYVETCGFTDYYDTVEACAFAFADFYTEDAPNFDDPACQAAVMSYMDCGAALSCDELDMFNNSCDAQFEAIDEPCGFIAP